MFHSNRIIYALLLAGAVLSGCSQREAIDIDIEDNPVVNQETASVVFKLQTNVPSTMVTRSSASAEDSYDYLQGTPDEYQVNNARVYLFDAPTKLFVKSVLLTDLKRTGSDADGYVIYETERVSVPQGTYDIFVTANTPRFINKKSESEFLADIDSVTYVKGTIDNISNGIVMTNRASENNNVVLVNNPDKGDNVVSITLERVLARIDVAKSSDQFELTENNNKYATISLEGYYIVNLPKYYYSYRHTAVLVSMDEPTWILSENFGNVKDVNGYVIDPYFFNKTLDASNFTNEDKYYVNYFGDFSNPNTIPWTSFQAAAQTPQYNTMYCLENCMFAQAQKNGYSTGIIFKAKLEPVGFFHLSENGLEYITDKNLYPEVLYYYNYHFYDSADALATAIGVKAITGANLDLYQAKQFVKDDTGYHCYYTYWIRHLDNLKPTVMGVMEFAIVRNNLYRILVANVSGLGYNEPPINPDTPDEGETYLKVVLNVKPWIVRDLTDIVL